MDKAINRGDGKWNCLTQVPARQGYGYHLCSKLACDDPDEDGNPTRCATHSKAGIERSKQRSDERYRQYTLEAERTQRLCAATAALEPALRQIAEGHNDARGLAQEAIAKIDAARNPK